MSECVVFFFKPKTAYELRISDWSSDVCSSDLDRAPGTVPQNSGCRLQHRAEIEEGHGAELHIAFLVNRRGKAEKALISRHVGGIERGDLTGERLQIGRAA